MPSPLAVYLCVWVGLIVSYTRFIYLFWAAVTLHAWAHKRIVNIMKVYIERDDIQVELIRFLQTNLLLKFCVALILAVYDCLGRLATASERSASTAHTNYDECHTQICILHESVGPICTLHKTTTCIHA